MERVRKHPASVALALLLSVFWIINLAAPEASQYFAMVPASVISEKQYLWTIITGSIMDSATILGLVDVVVVITVAPVLERYYGSKEFVIFLVATNLTILISVYFSLLFAYTLTGKDTFYFMSVTGFSGLNAAFGVGLKQRNPSQQIFPFYKSAKIQHLPFSAICLSVALSAVAPDLVPWSKTWLITSGTFWGWFYLRHFMKYELNLPGERGDGNFEFDFSTLFPRKGGFRKVASTLARFTWKMMKVTRLSECIKHNSSDGASKPIHSTNSKSSVELDPLAQQRRAIGIAEIDAQLAKLTKESAFSSNPIKPVVKPTSTSTPAPTTAESPKPQESPV